MKNEDDKIKQPRVRQPSRKSLPDKPPPGRTQEVHPESDDPALSGEALTSPRVWVPSVALAC